MRESVGLKSYQCSSCDPELWEKLYSSDELEPEYEPDDGECDYCSEPLDGVPEDRLCEDCYEEKLRLYDS